MSAAQHQQSVVSGADSPILKQDGKTSQCWHLHHGFAQVFIVGEGSLAWLACTAADYSRGPAKGTPQEMAVARRALEILRKDHANNMDACPAVIRSALQAARAETLSS